MNRRRAEALVDDWRKRWPWAEQILGELAPYAREMITDLVSLGDGERRELATARLDRARAEGRLASIRHEAEEALRLMGYTPTSVVWQRLLAVSLLTELSVRDPEEPRAPAPTEFEEEPTPVETLRGKRGQ